MRIDFPKALCSLVLLSACAGTDASPVTEPAVDNTDTSEETGPATPEVEVPTGCVDDDSVISDLSIDEAEVATVFTVSWTPEQDGTATLLMNIDGETQVMPATMDDDRATVQVLGVPQDHEVRYRVVVAHGSDTWCTSEQVHETPLLSTELPAFTVSGDPEAAPGFFSVPIISTLGNTLAVLDAQGRYVWTSSVSDTPYRLEFDSAGDGLLVNRHAHAADDPGNITHHAWDGTTTLLAKADGLTKDFCINDEGRIFSLAWDLREIEHEGETRKILGDRLVEVDADGVVNEIWSVWDHFEPNLDKVAHQGGYIADDEVEDWSHANGLSCDVDDGAVLVSVANLQAIVSVDVETGEERWTLATDNAPAAPADEPLEADTMTPIMNPHSVYRTDNDEIMVFNRMQLGAGCSQVDTFAIDEEAGSAELVDSYAGTECLGIYFLGMARPIADDRTLISWTTAGRLEQLDANGEHVWALQSEMGAGLAYTDHRPAMGVAD